MTYCLALKVNDGLVLASDTRTNAGVDNICTYQKLFSFEDPNKGVLGVMVSGNLATTQKLMYLLEKEYQENGFWTFNHFVDFAHHVQKLLHEILRYQLEKVGDAPEDRHPYHASAIVAGQVYGEYVSMYLVNSNNEELKSDIGFLQIGETAYGKPILDRLWKPELTLEETARLALLSLESTMRSNLSVSLPMDMLFIKNNTYQVSKKMRFDHHDPYFKDFRKQWEQSLRNIMTKLPKFDYENIQKVVPPNL